MSRHSDGNRIQELPSGDLVISTADIHADLRGWPETLIPRTLHPLSLCTVSVHGVAVRDALPNVYRIRSRNGLITHAV